MANALEGDRTDQECIRRVLAEFIQLRDDKRFAEWVDLFSEDATFEYGSHHLVGRSAIRENVEALLRNDRGKHLCVNSIIDVSGDTASVSSDFLKVDPIDDGSGATGYGIGTMGRYEDHFVRQGGEWKIAKRTVHIMSPTDGP
ncbi:MAG: nuclear transport factor 2 family protein [Acidimicrobiales bacterium]|jgi:ketosteroid isomerase-like protein